MHLRQGTDDESVIYLLTNSVLDDTGEKMFATTDKAAIQGLAIRRRCSCGCRNGGVGHDRAEKTGGQRWQQPGTN